MYVPKIEFVFMRAEGPLAVSHTLVGLSMVEIFRGFLERSLPRQSSSKRSLKAKRQVSSEAIPRRVSALGRKAVPCRSRAVMA